MRCFQHNEREAVGTCSACGAGGCSECLIHFQGTKMCAGCAQGVYDEQVAAIRSEAAAARRKLFVLACICGFFFLTSLLFWGNVLMALGSAYGWGSVYVGTMPFVRAVGSRISGGAISSSVTGALFGTLWFWVVTGWWLFLLGTLYAYLGGGIFHFVRLLQRWRSAEARAANVAAPTGAAQAAQVPLGTSSPAIRPSPVESPSAATNPSTLAAAAPALLALLFVGYCSVQSLGGSGSSGCASTDAASASHGEEPATQQAAMFPRPTPVVNRPVATTSAATPQPAPPVKIPSQNDANGVEALLANYYSDLNGKRFDANRYFESSVERYITMMGTSTSAMNQYIQNVFPKQFQQYQFSLEAGSLSSEGPSQYVYVERSSYYLTAKKKTLNQRVRVRIKLSPAGKMVFFHQFERLPWQPEPTAASAGLAAE